MAVNSFIQQHIQMTDVKGNSVNTNYTLVDPFLHNLSQQTLNKNYIQQVNNFKNSLALKADGRHNAFNSLPPNYITAEITVYHGGITSGKLYLLFPGEVSESSSANYVKESPVGSTYPIVAFGNTQPSQVNLSFIALADYLPQGETSLDSYIKSIRSMLQPSYPDSSHVSAPTVYVHLGNVRFSGVCDSVNINYYNLFNRQTYVKADISCSFTVSKWY